MAETEQTRIERHAFTMWAASLPRTSKVVGEYADGTEVTVEVPSVFS